MKFQRFLHPFWSVLEAKQKHFKALEKGGIQKNSSTMVNFHSDKKSYYRAVEKVEFDDHDKVFYSGNFEI